MQFEIRIEDGRHVLYVDGTLVGPEGGFATRADALAALPEYVDTEEVYASQGDGLARFSIPVVVEEGVMTDDGRLIEDGATEWRTPPLPLMFQSETSFGHDGAVLAGRIDTIVRGDGGISAEGWLHESEGGRALNEVLASDGRFGFSADMARQEGDFECTEEDEDGWCVDGVFRFTLARLMGGTATPFPAFENAHIVLAETPAETDDEETETDEEDEAVAAAGQRVEGRRDSLADASWFSNPGLDGPTALTVEDDGRIYGHLATWGTCHVGRDDVCLTPPRSAAGYSYFATGEFRCQPCGDEERVPVGAITMDTGHASLSAGHRSAASHYDNTGTVVADVSAGEDEHGIWVSGRVRPEVLEDPDRLAALRASSLSGDWRRIGGSLELIAALAVNVPGFPIPRAMAASGAEVVDLSPRAHVADDQQTALVASGLVRHARRVPGSGAIDDETREILRRVDRFVQRQQDYAAREARSKVATSRERVGEFRTRRADAARTRVRGN